MANEEDKTTVETGETAANGADGKAAGGSRKLIMVGGIGLGAVIVGVALALFVLKPMMADSGEPADNHAAVEKTENKEPAREEKESDDQERKGEAETLMYSIDDIVINPAGTGGSRFLSVSFGFELESPSMLSAFRAREPIIRDALITILTSKTVAQLTDIRQKEIIRYQIKKRVSELMKTEALAGVYYTDFVLQ